MKLAFSEIVHIASNCILINSSSLITFAVQFIISNMVLKCEECTSCMPKKCWLPIVHDVNVYWPKILSFSTGKWQYPLAFSQLIAQICRPVSSLFNTFLFIVLTRYWKWENVRRRKFPPPLVFVFKNVFEFWSYVWKSDDNPHLITSSKRYDLCPQDF